MMREGAERTGDEVGDGTSTTLVAHTILEVGVRNLAAGASAVDLKLVLDRGLRVTVASLKTTRARILERHADKRDFVLRSASRLEKLDSIPVGIFDSDLPTARGLKR